MKHIKLYTEYDSTNFFRKLFIDVLIDGKSMTQSFPNDTPTLDEFFHTIKTLIRQENVAEFDKRNEEK